MGESIWIPAVLALIHSMQETAGFFSVLASEVEQFANTGDKAIARGPARIHYTMMKGKATRLMGRCDIFIWSKPAFAADMDSIPYGAGPNYVQSWLESKRG